jgi:hypothetical protein
LIGFQDERLRVFSIKVMVDVGRKDIIPSLEEILNDEGSSERLRKTAAKALRLLRKRGIKIIVEGKRGLPDGH